MLHADRLLYVVGSPQSQHLEMVYEAGRMAGWLKPPATTEHIVFGSVLGYMQYAHARVQFIVCRAMASHGIDAAEIGQAPMMIADEAEKMLAMQLLRFAEFIEDVSGSLLFHRLAIYLFDLATAYSGFYNSWPVVDAPDAQTRLSRLALCRLTARTLETGLSLLGIRAPERM